jgi:multiple sugar transport system permease protein
VTAATSSRGRSFRSDSGFLDSERAYVVAVAATLLWLVAFIGYPFAYNIVMSVQEVSFGNLRSMARPFVGLANYRDVVEDPVFWRVVSNTALFVGGNVALSFVLGLTLALFFDRGFPGAAFLRGLLLAGWILPPMVAGAVFKWILATEYGVLNEALSLLGILKGRVHWISDPDVALLSVTIANVWYGTPFTMILLAAGLATLPQELYEASALDGAGRWGRFVHVTLPLLMPTMLAVLALTTIYTLRVFDLIWTMTRGGPVDSTNILPLWSFLYSFELFRFGHGAAVATLSMGIVIVVAAVYVRSLRAEQRL